VTGSPVTGRRVIRALVVAILMAIATSTGWGASPARASSDITFGPPTITATFQVGIDVSEPARLPDGVHRIEALVHTGTDARTFAEVVNASAVAGPTQLTYRLATPAGGMLPNTVVEIHFRVTFDDGTSAEGPTATVRYADTRFAWKTLTGQIVRVHWVDGDDAFGRRALAIGDKAVADTSRLLGVSETEPIDFFIYPDATSFYDVLGPGAREHVGGVAFPDIRTLLADIEPSQLNDAWVGIVIPHELTHLVFGTAVDNPYHSPPHWFNEGLAVYLSQGYTTDDRASVESAAGNGTLMPLTAIDGQFPTSGDRFSLAYAESVSSIDYLIRTYGQDALVALIKTWGTGVSDDAAFRAALGVDVAGFQAGWLAALGIPEPSPFGPRPAPGGPLPPGWSGAAATPGALGPGSSGGSPSPAGGGGGGGPDLLLEALLVTLAAFVVIGAAAFAARRRRAAQVGAAPHDADDDAPDGGDPPATMAS
jgi:hypothetical protein